MVHPLYQNPTIFPDRDLCDSKWDGQLPCIDHIGRVDHLPLILLKGIYRISSSLHFQTRFS